MDKAVVVKIGGVVSRTSDTMVEDIVAIQRTGRPLVVVHGGGNLITEWLARQGVSTRFIHGERVTDKTTLEVVIAVLSGLANKQMVAAINAAGGRAFGISGVDGGLVCGEVKSKELGYVGAVSRVNPAPLLTLLQAGYVPVVSPVSLNTTAEDVLIVNINGDPVAGELALGIKAERLFFLTDVPGVCRESGELVPRLGGAEAEALIASGTVSGGMIPKIRASLRALSGGCLTRIIDGRPGHALLREIRESTGGTTIAND